ncbi:NAD(P)/FAD-dependent oxidoreductase [Clostridium sp. LY3-2]|uniref:NAD(P)/FAD-dependent oxidoreductase n=1 Tax=Clostridium sp. LY3-2 TaxID=2942482 RepID=UPI002152CD87|nr:NAD(P)/FAD-dependent oxidoreductase [Clostridium sp. LY3-2]MCR6515911.1 NAD(P)/FAD-dependent oxidoreductase [Clostridium sp. LY3-2]
MEKYDLIVIGGGISGLNCALNAYERGMEKVLVIEKDNKIGGMLKGVKKYKEYIEKLVSNIECTDIKIKLNTQVISIDDKNNVIATSMENGIEKLESKNIIISSGAKEKGKNALNISGDRCSGIYTVNMADKILDMENVNIGDNVVIFGGADLYKISDKLKEKNINISAIVCLGLNQEVFDLTNHILFNYRIKTIKGNGRIEEVVLDNGNSKNLKCDTLIVAAGIVPDGIIGMISNITLNKENGGILVNPVFKTSRENIYAIGDCVDVKNNIDEIEKNSKTLVYNLNL